MSVAKFSFALALAAMSFVILGSCAIATASASAMTEMRLPYVNQPPPSCPPPGFQAKPDLDLEAYVDGRWFVQRQKAVKCIARPRRESERDSVDRRMIDHSHTNSNCRATTLGTHRTDLPIEDNFCVTARYEIDNSPSRGFWQGVFAIGQSANEEVRSRENV